MPGNLMMMDASFPRIEDGEDTATAIRKIQNYLFVLLEQLRYTLQNLEPGNFNANEMEAYFKRLTADLVVAQTIISNTVITNELYAQYGSIADLTVDKLRTDYKRARKYLAGDTSQIDYISIYDEQILFITATTDGARTEQMTVDGRKFWWTDNKKTLMTSEKDTGIPVTVYVYQEMVKGSFCFQPITLEDGTQAPMPVLTFGAGTGVGERGKALFKKNERTMMMEYQSQAGQTAGIYMRDDGFVDVTHRRADVTIDTAANTISVQPEGALAKPIKINYVENGDVLTLTWPDGKSFKVVKK